MTNKVLTTINHTTIEALGFKQVPTPAGAGFTDTYIKGTITVRFDQLGGYQAIVSGSPVPSMNLEKLKLYLKRP